MKPNRNDLKAAQIIDEQWQQTSNGENYDAPDTAVLIAEHMEEERKAVKDLIEWIDSHGGDLSPSEIPSQILLTLRGSVNKMEDYYEKV